MIAILLFATSTLQSKGTNFAIGKRNFLFPDSNVPIDISKFAVAGSKLGV